MPLAGGSRGEKSPGSREELDEQVEEVVYECRVGEEQLRMIVGVERAAINAQSQLVEKGVQDVQYHRRGE